MAGNGIGFSFQPGQQSVPVGGNRAIGGPQSAVQVKSLTLPNRFVPGQIAPQALLQSAGGGGQMPVQVLQQLMQAFAPQGQQPGVPALAQSFGGSLQQENQMNGRSPWSDVGALFGSPAPAANPSMGHGAPKMIAPPRIVPTDGERAEAEPNPYLNPAHYAPAPTESIAPLELPAPVNYHFGETPSPPTPRPLPFKFHDMDFDRG